MPAACSSSAIQLSAGGSSPPGWGGAPGRGCSPRAQQPSSNRPAAKLSAWPTSQRACRGGRERVSGGREWVTAAAVGLTGGGSLQPGWSSGMKRRWAGTQQAGTQRPARSRLRTCAPPRVPGPHAAWHNAAHATARRRRGCGGQWGQACRRLRGSVDNGETAQGEHWRPVRTGGPSVPE